MQIIDDRLPPPLSLSLLPCCGVEHRGELSAAAWRANDTRLYISISIYIYIYKLTPAKYASHRFMTPRFSTTLPPSAYLPSFSLYLLVSIFISSFIARIYLRMYIIRRVQARRFRDMREVERACVHYQGGKIERERGVASRARPSLGTSPSLFISLFVHIYIYIASSFIGSFEIRSL